MTVKKLSDTRSADASTYASAVSSSVDLSSIEGSQISEAGMYGSQACLDLKYLQENQSLSVCTTAVSKDGEVNEGEAMLIACKKENMRLRKQRAESEDMCNHLEKDLTQTKAEKDKMQRQFEQTLRSHEREMVAMQQRHLLIEAALRAQLSRACQLGSALSEIRETRLGEITFAMCFLAWRRHAFA
jgi:septal ring factor EnvC (AmiA/AmiB activator)